MEPKECPWCTHDEALCAARKDAGGFELQCTREAGHDGNHVACGAQHEMLTWAEVAPVDMGALADKLARYAAVDAEWNRLRDEITADVLRLQCSVDTAGVNALYVQGATFYDHEGDVERYIDAMMAQGEWDAQSQAEAAIAANTKQTVAWAAVVDDLKAKGVLWTSTAARRGEPRVTIKVKKIVT